MQVVDFPAWQKLQRDFEQTQHIHLRQQFADDPDRSARYDVSVGGIRLDYSKNRINDTILQHLLELADEVKLPAKRDAMFAGQKINQTENRAVLHTALRQRDDEPVWVDQHNVIPDVKRVLQQMGAFSNAVRNGEWKGFTGKAITDIVNIGIGGSDLGPQMMCEVLKDFGHPRLRMHFVSTVDDAQLNSVLQNVQAETTLFIIASKTFTTQETMTNAQAARHWFLQYAAERDISQHFVAVSTNKQAVADFGINPDHAFEFWDWVGGRYSLWSAIGLSIMLYLGEAHFTQMLEGAYLMDQHFQNAPLSRNMPVILALLGIWYHNFYHAESHVIAPYDNDLRYFPKFIQQLDMESNGKHINADGENVKYSTGPIVWGETGINSQHAFFQLIHQGTHLISLDFIVSLSKKSHFPEHQHILVSNAFAQAQAFMRGKNAQEVRAELLAEGLSEKAIEQLLPHKIFEGNRPSNMILLNEINPKNMGSLVALYEHKVFVQGAIWHINSFDQWGVELGKQLAKTILSELKSGQISAAHDSSTEKLIRLYQEANAKPN